LDSHFGKLDFMELWYMLSIVLGIGNILLSALLLEWRLPRWRPLRVGVLAALSKLMAKMAGG
jgi:hypothetical protein